MANDFPDSDYEPDDSHREGPEPEQRSPDEPGGEEGTNPGLAQEAESDDPERRLDDLPTAKGIANAVMNEIERTVGGWIFSDRDAAETMVRHMVSDRISEVLIQAATDEVIRMSQLMGKTKPPGNSSLN